MSNYWPSTSGDWASWVQAIGTLAAIGFAWWVARRESRSARAQARFAEELRLFRVAMSALLVSRTLDTAFGELSDAVRAQKPGAISRAFTVFSEAWVLGRSIDLTMLMHGKDAERLLRQRSLASRALWFDERRPNWSEFQRLAESWALEAHEHRIADERSAELNFPEAPKMPA